MKILTMAAGLLAFAGAANAHVTLEQKDIAAGSTGKITLRVPHGCDGAATNALHVTIPKGFGHVKPMPKPGWDLQTLRTGADVTGVVWSNGNLPDDFYDEFTMRGTVGKDVAPGAMFFATEQDCGNAKVLWNDMSDDDELETAAPRVRIVTAGAETGHDHMAMGEGATPPGSEKSYAVGALTIKAPYARATLPGAPVGGGYFSITNAGSTDDRLVSVASDIAGKMQLHAMEMNGDVMQMRAMSEGLSIPAGQTVALTPGGNHIMFSALKGPMVQGTVVTVTLTFEKAGKVDIPLAVGAPDAQSAAAGGLSR